MFLAFSGIAGLVDLVCLIIVIIKLFQDNKVLLGILSIPCGIIAFVVGWQNVDRYKIKNVMIVWSVALVISIATSVYVRINAPTTTVTYPGGTTVTR